MYIKHGSSHHSSPVTGNLLVPLVQLPAKSLDKVDEGGGCDRKGVGEFVCCPLRSRDNTAMDLHAGGCHLLLQLLQVDREQKSMFCSIVVA